MISVLKNPLSIRLASIADIGLMKLDALITRGARKDFIDLFFILRLMSMDDYLFDSTLAVVRSSPGVTLWSTSSAMRN